MTRITASVIGATSLGLQAAIAVALVAGFAWLGCARQHAEPSPTQSAPSGTYRAPEFPRRAPTPVPPATAVYTRIELAKWFKEADRTAEDVKAKIGRPAETERIDGGRFGADYIVYVYHGLTVDSDGSGRTDGTTRIEFAEANGLYVRTLFSGLFSGP